MFHVSCFVRRTAQPPWNGSFGYTLDQCCRAGLFLAGSSELRAVDISPTPALGSNCSVFFLSQKLYIFRSVKSWNFKSRFRLRHRNTKIVFLYEVHDFIHNCEHNFNYWTNTNEKNFELPRTTSVTKSMNHNHFTHPGEGYRQRISDQDDIVNLLTNLWVEQKMWKTYRTGVSMLL